jgi:hypothetical protein
MSGPRRRPKALKIDRDVLRDARIKRHKHDRGGIGGLLITLAIAAAVGILVYVHRDQPPPPQPVQKQIASALVEPVSDVVVQDESVEDIVETAEPIATFDEPTQPRHDHLSPELLEPSTRRIILQAGRLDGHPEHTAAPFAGEFGRDNAPGTIVRVEAERIREDFPQRILAGQSIVLHVPEMEAQDLLFRLMTVREVLPAADSVYRDALAALRILCNGEAIWDRTLGTQGILLTALIPQAYLEPYRNTITLQNIGPRDVVFDALWIESAGAAAESVQLRFKDWRAIPDDYKGFFAWNRQREQGPAEEEHLFLPDPVQIVETGIRRAERLSASVQVGWRYQNTIFDFKSQERVVQNFLSRAVAWYFHGGSAIWLSNITGPGRFFCAHTGRLYPSSHALWLLSRLFEGEARRLPLNVLGNGQSGQPLDQVYWLATGNKPGVASIIITRDKYGSIPGGQVRVVCALPWKGTTAVSVSKGVFPEFVNMVKPTYRGVFVGENRQDDPDGQYDRNREDKTFNRRLATNGQGGLLDIELDIEDSLYIRLVKEGADPSIAGPGSDHVTSPTATPAATLAAGSVAGNRESGLLRQKSLAVFPGVMHPLSANYRVRIGKATRGTVQGLDYVAPEAAQSIFCEIDYTKGQSRTADGALLELYTLREQVAGKSLSFWVYPHTRPSGKRVLLRMSLGTWHGRVTLEPGKWQRVELQFTRAEPDPYLLILGPPHEEILGKEDVITFEFNGIKLLDPRGTAARHMDARLLPDGRFAIVVLGEPGKEGRARQVFQKPVGLNAVTSAGAPDTAIQWAYSPETQILEIPQLRFPATADTTVLTYLNRQERELCRQSGLVPVVLILEIDI